MMDIRQLQYFVALYEEGSITKAARRMHVVQAAISQQIKRLEVSAGVQLFDRDAHGTVPTHLASAFYERCLQVLVEMERARAVLVDAAQHLNGKLAVGAQASFNQFVIPSALEQFHEFYPAIELSAREGYRRDLIEWVQQGELDIALLSTTEQLLTLGSQAISSEELVVVGHRDTLAGCEALAGADLGRHRLVLPSRAKSMRNLIDAQFGLHGLVTRPELEVDSMEALLRLVHRPRWVSIVPRSTLARNDGSESLVRVPLVRPTIQRQVVAAWQPQKLPSAFMAEFLRFVRQALATIPDVDVLDDAQLPPDR